MVCLPEGGISFRGSNESRRLLYTIVGSSRLGEPLLPEDRGPVVRGPQMQENISTFAG